MRYRASQTPLTWLGGVLALYLAIPLVAFLVRLAQPGDRGFGIPGLWSALLTSAGAATISTALVAIFGIPMAYWLARSRGLLARVVGMLVLLPIALPPVMSGIVLIYLVGPYTFLGQLFNGGLTDSVAGVVLAQSFVAGPFLVIAARAAFSAIDPAFEELAASLGHRPTARFVIVSMRIAAPGIRAGLLMTWLRAVGEYGATVLLAYHPYTLPVFTFVQFSSTGIPATQAPTALALGMAVVVLVATEIRPPARLLASFKEITARSREAGEELAGAAGAPGMVTCAVAGALAEQAGVPPMGTVEQVRVRLDIDAMVGGFRLRVAHDAASHRIAILGSSGAGKSMTLRAIAGFLGPDAGGVWLNGERVDTVRVEARGVGYVPQGMALFPGRPVWRQATFAVGADPELAAWWLRTLGIDNLRDRYPDELSGGQQQRVALARALAFRPRLVLLDEPFSALDTPVRDELRREVRLLQREAGLSTVLVTHDPEEAALLADEILVVDEGQLLQAGPTSEVFARPASPRVARLLGIANLSLGTVTAPGALTAAGQRVAAGTGDLPPGTAVLWSIRPDRIVVTPAEGGDGCLAVVEDVADIGTMTTLTVRLLAGAGAGASAGPDAPPGLRVRTTVPPGLAPGDACRVLLDPAAITLWPVTVPVTRDERRPAAARRTARSRSPRHPGSPVPHLLGNSGTRYMRAAHERRRPYVTEGAVAEEPVASPGL